MRRGLGVELARWRSRGVVVAMMVAALLLAVVAAGLVAWQSRPLTEADQRDADAQSALAARDPRIGVSELAVNVGQHAALRRGLADEGDALIADTQAQIDAAAEANPEFEGLTATAATSVLAASAVPAVASPAVSPPATTSMVS